MLPSDLKLCALLKAVSNEGFEVLYAREIDIHSEELNYEQVLQALKNVYAREDLLNTGACCEPPNIRTFWG